MPISPDNYAKATENMYKTEKLGSDKEEKKTEKQKVKLDEDLR